MNVKTGDVVTIANNATYYNGKSMPGWVKNDQWIVKSVNGDRAVIDKNVSGSSSINSPVSTAFLTVKGVQESPKPAVVPTQPSGAGGSMRVSDRGVELVAKYEGCRLEAYKCPAGVWTIGYGHTAGVKPGDRLASKAEAKQLLVQELVRYADSVNACVRSGKLTFVPNQNQFDALTSFCYNCGVGSLQKLVTGRTAEQIASSMLLYNKGGGRVLEGLVKRRKEEQELFLS